MFICTDCRQEFDIKPEYCDCGNNVFEEAIPQEISVKTPIAEPISSTKDDSFIPKPSFKNPLESASVAIFLLCIVLSILSIIFIGNERTDYHANSTKNKTKTEKIQQKNTAKIPSIEQLWIEPQISQIETDEKSSFITETSSIKEEKSLQVPIVPKSVIPPPKKIIKQTQALSPQKPVVQKIAKPIINPAAAQQELIRYKVALRNKIAADINFAAVIGDGICSISFKVDSSGNLTNRTFVKQSENDSLNDMVYSAMMQNPAFRVPPSLYKNETLKLTVKMHGGSYEVSLN